MSVRILAAVSLGGAGNLNPLVPFLHAARRRGDDVLVVGPAALAELVPTTGFTFEAGGEPAEVEVAPIREHLLPHRRQRHLSSVTASCSVGSEHGLSSQR